MPVLELAVVMVTGSTKASSEQVRQSEPSMPSFPETWSGQRFRAVVEYERCLGRRRSLHAEPGDARASRGVRTGAPRTSDQP